MNTACDVYQLAMSEFKYFTKDGDTWATRIIPSSEQAIDFVSCVKTLRNFNNGIIHLPDDKVEILMKKEETYDRMGLDMRDEVFAEDGKHGLRHLTGELVVPALFDGIAERYDYIADIRESWGRNMAVPVIRNGMFALCRLDGKGTLTTEFVYDRLYRFFGPRINCFVGERQGKKGVVNPISGKEVVPCLMDDIYEMVDFDGVIPFRKDGKWGLSFNNVCTKPTFDDVDISSENYAIVLFNDSWYYINSRGEMARERKDAAFGSWYDINK